MRGLLQYTLNLFDSLSADAPELTVPSTEKPPRVVDTPSVPAAPAADPVKRTSKPEISLADSLAPARFVHPRATREATLGNARVAYEFTRGQRRTIGFVVGAEGLSVRAPRWVALRDVDAALQEKSAWILRKLAEADQRYAQIEATRIEWRDGVSFPYLGEPVVVRLDPKHGFKGVGAVLEAGDAAGPKTLRMALAHNATPEQIRDAAQAWLSRQARRIFIERLDHFAQRLGVRWTRLSLSNASTRWGQRQHRRRDSPALATGSFPDAGDRLRGCARVEPSARDGPQPEVLGDGRERGARLRRASQAAQGRDDPRWT